MYEYNCVRQAGCVLEYAHLRDNLYQCMGCKRHKKMRYVTIVNDELVPSKLHPEDGHHIECAPMPRAVPGSNGDILVTRLLFSRWTIGLTAYKVIVSNC